MDIDRWIGLLHVGLKMADELFWYLLLLFLFFFVFVFFVKVVSFVERLVQLFYSQ